MFLDGKGELDFDQTLNYTTQPDRNKVRWGRCEVDAGTHIGLSGQLGHFLFTQVSPFGDFTYSFVLPSNPEL